MKGLAVKVKRLVDKIGKINFFFILFILIVVCVTALYQTFSLYTVSDGVSIIDNIKTYHFILTSNGENSVTIAPGSNKKIMITISNSEKLNLRYGIYYSSSNDLTNVDLGYLSSTEHLPSGIIESNNKYVVEIQIYNSSNNNVTLSFGVKYGLVGGGALVKEENQYWVEKLNVALNKTEIGSYVAYVGNNGCSGAGCIGGNANYESDTNRGYCWSSDYKFYASGWRIAYIKDGVVYLTSAGATDCIATDHTGAISSSQASSGEGTAGVPLHLANVKNTALKYCNSVYAYGNVCDNSSTWAFNDSDFQEITSSSFETCAGVSSDECGLGTIIDNGGYYWIATPTTSNTMYHWHPQVQYYSAYYSYIPLGVRPVIKLSSDVEVIEGDGSYFNPYRIATDAVKINDLSGHKNYAVNYGATWDKTNGTITTNGSDHNVRVSLAHYDFKDSISIVLRLKMNSIIDGDFQNLFTQLGNSTNGTNVFLAGGNKVTFATTTTESGYHSIVTNSELSLNTWYTIVAIYNGESLNVYVDGVKSTILSGYEQYVATTGDIIVSNQDFYFGGALTKDGTIGYPSNVTFSDALVFDRVLSEQEITENYSGNIQLTDTEDLLLYYDFK